jgi:hypothetical protein
MKGNNTFFNAADFDCQRAARRGFFLADQYDSDPPGQSRGAGRFRLLDHEHLFGIAQERCSQKI